MNGQSIPIVRADYFGMAVPLARGKNSVELRFQPSGFTMGWIVSLFAVLIGVVILSIPRLRNSQAGLQ